MEIEIKHCNNIDTANISISDGKLNIKFAPNGTGKSTIAKAIQFTASNDNQALSELLPFKYRSNNSDNHSPEVTGMNDIASILCFNEEYVNMFTFKQDELVTNSFEIFIKTDNYKAIEEEIAALVQEIQHQFTNNPELEKLISNLKELSGAFKVTAKGQLSKASTGMKGLSGGNKIEHIPKGLEPYKPFIQSNKNVTWIDWQAKGKKEFSELSDACPYCSTDSTDKKEQIDRVSQEYDKNLIKNLVNIITVVESLGDYFSDKTREKLSLITSLKDGIGDEHQAFIVNIKSQIDNLISKLENLRTLSGFHFKADEEVSQTLPTFKLDLNFFEYLDSEKTREAVEAINASIEQLESQAGQLQGRVNVQRIEIQRLVEKHQTDINNFLSYAGYKYKVQIVGEGENSQLKLLHIEHKEYLTGGNQHLSYGERNAFAIILFMYECLAKKPDLIILDDPISSFDKNKKFAILEMLFRRDADSCLKNKTVLMLTHDIEPIIDTLKSVRGQFNNQVFASYLRLNNGNISEKIIEGRNIKTFAQICNEAINSDCDTIIKLIYLRRHFEILDDRGDAYQILSNLLHKRETPIDTREPAGEEQEFPEMTQENLENGTNRIIEYIGDFDYDAVLASLTNKEELIELYKECQIGYEKLQLFRLLADEDIENSVIKKFINETYHIENEFICQLNPSEFDLVPEYVIDECNSILSL